jgi:hypothetical protein
MRVRVDALLLDVTFITFLERTLFLFFVTILAVLVVSILQLHNLNTVFRGVLFRVMTLAAFIHMFSLFPHVFAVFVNMMAIITFNTIVIYMLFVAQGYRTFLIFFVVFILDDYRIGNRLGRNKRTDREKDQPGKNYRKENTESFDHLGFTSFLDEFLCL